MKFIKRIQVGNKMADLQRLSIEEMIAILGGTGCCYDVIAELWSRIYGGYGKVSTPTASQIQQSFTDWMGKMETEGGWGDECKMAEDGDPTLAQFSFLRMWMEGQGFSCGSIVNGGSNGSYNFGIIPGEENGYHAVIIEGAKFEGSDGHYYYNVSDPNNGGASYSIREDELMKSMSVSEKIDCR